MADFAVQLCHRLCQDAWSYQKLKGLLPDQIASVQHLPLSLKGKGLVEVSGTMMPGIYLIELLYTGIYRAVLVYFEVFRGPILLSLKA